MALPAVRRTDRHGPVDPSLAAFISPMPWRWRACAWIRLRTTPLYHKLAEQGKLPKFDAFRTESGFDPSQDVRELLVASDGQNVLAIARGTFTAKPSRDLESSDYRGYTLYAKSPDEVIVFIDKSTALGGPATSVRAAIDQFKRGGHGAPRDLMARAEALPSDAQIWAVVVGWRGASPDRLRGMGDLSNVDRMLRSVDDATMTIDLRHGAHAAITGDCHAEGDARNMADSLRGLAALVRMAVPKNQPDLQRGLDTIQVKQEGRVVRLTADIPEDLAEKLLM